MLSRDAPARVVNMGVGGVGAVIAGWFVAPLMGPDLDQLAVADLRSVLVSMFGGALLTLGYNIVRWGDTD